jgi:hypothetical protein
MDWEEPLPSSSSPNVSSSTPRDDTITGQVPYFIQRPTEEAMLADVYATLRWLNSLSVSQIEGGGAVQVEISVEL